MANEIKWICSNCEAENVDYPGETAVPLCGNCDDEVFWSELNARTIESGGIEYKLKPKANVAEFPWSESDISKLLWINNHTYPRGYQKERLRIGGAKLI